MQTLAFLWYELKAAKRHVKEAVAECQQCGKVDFSFLNRPPEASVVDEGRKRGSVVYGPRRGRAKNSARRAPC